MCTATTSWIAGLAAVSLAVLAGSAEAKVVGDGKLENYCAEEAMVRMNVDRADILTLPTELLKGRYFVNGQTPTDGTNVRTFECEFNGKKMLTGFKVDGKAVGAAPAAASAPAPVPGVPKPALDACMAKLGVAATVAEVSALKPGYQEVILKAKKGKRKVACTVSDAGSIEDWVEMR